MNYITLLNLFCGFMLSYALFNIIDILKTNKKISNLKSKLEKMGDEEAPTAYKLDSNESDPLKAMHKALTEAFNMPEEKVILHNNNNSLSIAYGYSCLIAIDRPETGHVNLAIGIDKTTDQSPEDRQKEFEELSALINNAGFDRVSFSRALAMLTVSIHKAEETKYSKVTRQIPHDML